ncbi:MAG: hypothetical protein Q8934_03190 [Bacillota bacterium]|nr:hypothetical protein [Bacillota bacterium]
MKIYDYYRDTAKARLNGSIAALVPAIIIVSGNLSFFQNNEIMLGTIPFLVYSLLSFQIYLFRHNQAILIGKNMSLSHRRVQTLFDAKHLLVVYLNVLSPKVMLFFTDGHLAGEIKKSKNRVRFLKLERCFTLTNSQKKVIATFKIEGRKKVKIQVFSEENKYLGCLERQKKLILQKDRKELLDSTGRYVGTIQGSSFYMDEQIYNKEDKRVGRLRRGWMPLEWESLFPEPNTPVLSFSEGLNEEDKLVGLSLLINEYFIER